MKKIDYFKTLNWSELRTEFRYHFYDKLGLGQQFASWGLILPLVQHTRKSSL